MITLENLTKSFDSRDGAVLALDDVTLDVPEGALCGLVGPSGSGKSTLTQCVSLRIRPDRGTIRFAGADVSTAGLTQLRAIRRQIGVVPPTETLLAQRTVAGNIAAPLEQLGMAGPQRRSRVAELLDLAGLVQRADDRPEELTPGQRQRVAVARALATGPALLLADEPTLDLDRQSAEPVLTVLDRARAELGVTVLLSSRNVETVSRVCDYVAVLDAGRLVEHGTLLNLATDPRSWVASAVLPSVPATLPPAIQAAVTVGYDRLADVVLVGFATIGALLPEAASRFGVTVSIVGGGIARLADTPVARFQIGVRGERADSALAWIADRGAVVHCAPRRPHCVAA